MTLYSKFSQRKDTFDSSDKLFDRSSDQPSRETVAAMLEAERIAKDPSVKGYTDLDELFSDLRA